MVAPKSCRGCVLLVAAWLQLVSGGVFEPRHWLSSTLHADQSTMAPPTCAQTTEIKSGQFLFGGAASKAMFIYDVSTNLTCPIEDFPVVISYAEGMVFKGKPTVCGGFTTNQCFDYDPSRDTTTHWKVISGMFTVSSYSAYMRMVSFGADKVALMGGRNGGTVEVISLNSSFDYTTEAPLPNALSRMCALSLNGSHIFVAGGRSGSGRVSKAFLYDTTNGNIENLANMTEARSDMRCQMRDKDGGQEIVVVGGQGTNGALSTTEIYDIASNTWNSGTPFPSPVQSYAGLMEFANDLYLLGGFDDDDEDIDAIWKLSSAENTWTK
eukprot:snap_masked-scaffold7826_size2991-processed-gene-0.0 protein:Tk01430 transcript:snap_masked-scaffold7826_size2991-processed-gene-0.0-mRNA-1 annotation:"kelch-like protein 40a-like"